MRSVKKMISDAERQQLHIGYKQTLRALNDGKAEKLFIAADADEKMITALKKAADEQNVSVTEVETMTELGNLCGIDVGSSCAVILK